MTGKRDKTEKPYKTSKYDRTENTHNNLNIDIRTKRNRDKTFKPGKIKLRGKQNSSCTYARNLPLLMLSILSNNFRLGTANNVAADEVMECPPRASPHGATEEMSSALTKRPSTRSK